MKGDKCKHCQGDGWYSDHDSLDNHGRDGECLTCPIQVQCHNCRATGKEL